MKQTVEKKKKGQIFCVIKFSELDYLSEKY